MRISWNLRLQVFTVFDLGNYKVYSVLPQYKRVLRDYSKVSYHLVHYALRIASYRNRLARNEEKTTSLGLGSWAILQWSCKAKQGSVFCSYPGFVYFDPHLITMCKITNLSVSCLHQNKTVWYWIFLFYFVADAAPHLLWIIHINFNIDWHLELRDKINATFKKNRNFNTLA